MAELIHSFTSIKSTMINSLFCDVFVLTPMQLTRYHIDSGKKTTIKNYDSTYEPLHMASSANKLYVVFDKFLDVYNNKTVRTHHFDFQGATAFTIHKDYVFFATNTHFVLLNTESFQFRKFEWNSKFKATCLACLSDIHLAVGDAKGYLRIYDYAKEQEIVCQKIHNDSIQDVVFIGNSLISVSRDKIIRKIEVSISEITELSITNSTKEFDHFINCALVTDKIYVGLSNGEVVILESNALNTIGKRSLHSDSIRRICRLDDNTIVTVSDDGSCIVTDILSENGYHTICPRKKILSKRFPKIKCARNYNNFLYVGISDGSLLKIDLTDVTQEVINKTSDIRTICLVEKDGIVIGYENGSLHFVREDKTIQKLKRGMTPYSMDYSPKNHLIFVGRRDGTIEKYLYNSEEHTFSFILSKRTHTSIVGDIKQVNSSLYSCSDDQSILVHDLSLNRIALVKPSDDCTALNNLLFKYDRIYISSDNGNVYVIDNEQKKGYTVSDFPIRALDHFGEFVILGDRHGKLIRLDKNLKHSVFYQGNSRVVTVFEYDSKLYVIFEDAIISFDRRDIEIMSRGTVFIIHGHNDALKTAVQLLLTRANIKSIVLHERPDRGRTIIDKLIEETKDCKFAIALLTSDDLTSDGKHHARQNVYLEIGYFIGKLDKSHVLMLKDNDVDIPTDLQGVLYTPMSNISDATWKMKVLKELSDVGFSVNVDEILSTI